ncbi:hypothetical protein OENI_80001 [Oenococcus oeni]|nr:hypothetical protein OENI_80001 [Oenococcus oeni]
MSNAMDKFFLILLYKLSRIFALKFICYNKYIHISLFQMPLV